MKHVALSSIFAASLFTAGGAHAASRIGELALSDYQASATQVGPNTWHYVGTLHIPVALGVVDVPGASVDMTFNSRGTLETISGTVGFPTLPGVGMFRGLGAMSSTGPSLQIGYDYPAAFNTLDLPLDEDQRYFYFMEQSGASLSWGPISLEAPGTGATLFALEPFAPTVFFYSDQLFPDSPIQAVSVGVSGRSTIPWRPEHTWGVETRMSPSTPLLGNLYLGGTIAIPTAIPELSVNVTGDVTLGADERTFASNGPDWMQWLGVNGDVALEAGLGPVSVDLSLGGATLLYTRGTSSSVAFSGTVGSNQLLGLPFGPKASMQAAGYFSQNANASSLMLQGDLAFPSAAARTKSFAKQAINASVLINSSGATIQGSARFIGTTIGVSGGIYGTRSRPYAVFDGSISHSFNAYVGKIKATISASFDTRDSDVDLSAKVKFCVKNIFTGDWACDSIGGSVSLNSNGNLRVCANVPGFGQACDTLD